MDKHLHIRILNVLQQNNAIGHMVDIKPVFLAELDSQEGRKNFKAQVDFLAAEGLIETAGKFEFLGWELLTGLYPIDNKKIEARLTGNWASYLSKRGAVKDDPSMILPPPPPQQAAPAIKLGLYEPPKTVLPYPGVKTDKDVPPPAPVKTAGSRLPDDDFEPFTVKAASSGRAQSGQSKAPPPPPPHPDNDKFLKEEDFLPFKVRNANKAKAPEPPAKPVQDEPILISKNPIYTAGPEALKAPAEEPFFTPPAASTPPPVPVQTIEQPVPVQAAPTPFEPEQLLPVEPAQFWPHRAAPPAPTIPEPDFTSAKTTYIAPKSEIRDQAVTVTPFTPKPPEPVKPQPAFEKSIRIPATVRRKNDDEDEAPIITARTAKRPPAEPQYMPEPPSPTPPPPPAASVVNLRNQAAGFAREPERSAPVPAYLSNKDAQLPPSTINYAAIRFDTEDNPFNGLSNITLDPDEEKKKKPKASPWAKVFKYTVIGFILLVFLAALALYIRRYG